MNSWEGEYQKLKIRSQLIINRKFRHLKYYSLNLIEWYSVGFALATIKINTEKILQ
jgi:hypothetical protein